MNTTQILVSEIREYLNIWNFPGGSASVPQTSAGHITATVKSKITQGNLMQKQKAKASSKSNIDKL